jgi:hypothetical protein
VHPFFLAPSGEAAVVSFLIERMCLSLSPHPQNPVIPREKVATISFHQEFPLMLDRDVAFSPSSTYRVLKGAGLLQPSAQLIGSSLQSGNTSGCCI